MLRERHFDVPKNFTVLFTSHVDVRNVPVIPRADRPRCANGSDAVGLWSNESEPLCVEEVEPCGEQQLVDEMVEGLGIQYNTNAPWRCISVHLISLNSSYCNSSSG